MALPKERRFPCAWESCGKSFARAFDLTRHYRVHTNERPFTCDVCEKTFANSSTLKVHLRVHTGEKPFSCDFPNCGKCFAELSAFTRHQRSHRQEKPYFCSYGNCQRWFSRKSCLDQHKKRYHPEDLAKDPMTTHSTPSRCYDARPYSDSVFPQLSLPQNQPLGLDGIQLPNHLDLFSLHPANTGTHSVPGQSTQVADSDLEMAVDRFMEDFGQSTIAFPHQYMGDDNLENTLNFPPFPY